jgi:RimJ/RimL family protein N-acetyltransferase
VTIPARTRHTILGTVTSGVLVHPPWGLPFGLERIKARTLAHDTASQRVPARAGFSREGVLRSLPPREAGRADVVFYSLLAGE